MPCRHKYIRTWVFEDTKEPSGLWSCVDCGLKFEPITQRKPLDWEPIREFWRNNSGINWDELEAAIKAAHGIKE